MPEVGMASIQVANISNASILFAGIINANITNAGIGMLTWEPGHPFVVRQKALATKPCDKKIDHVDFEIMI